jgi:hypothetical protein
VRLKTELALHGCEMNPDEFAEVLTDIFATMCPSWNVEELLYHPKEASEFVRAVQNQAGKALPDHVILRRLNNIHKKQGGTTAVRVKATEKLSRGAKHKK